MKAQCTYCERWTDQKNLNLRWGNMYCDKCCDERDEAAIENTGNVETVFTTALPSGGE